MVKNIQKINQLGHNQQTILNTTINDNEKLNIVMVHSNPLNYAIRDKLALQFKERMLLYHNVNLIIVEVVYGNKHFKITDKNNISHAQLGTSNENIFWNKENLTNIGGKNYYKMNHIIKIFVLLIVTYILMTYIG